MDEQECNIIVTICCNKGLVDSIVYRIPEGVSEEIDGEVGLRVQVTTIACQDTTVMAGSLDTNISKWDLR